MQILVDTKFWNEAYKHMQPSSALWIKQNKGKSKKIIRDMAILNLNEHMNKKGFFYKTLIKDYGQWYQNWSTVVDQKDIEIALIKTAIIKYNLPVSALYEGSPVIQQPAKELLITNADLLPGNGYGFVYLVRNGDLFKIGITENLLRRLSEIKPDEVLDVIRCQNYQDVERKIHNKFKEVRIPQTEYFRLTPAHVQEVHSLMRNIPSDQ